MTTRKKESPPFTGRGFLLTGDAVAVLLTHYTTLRTLQEPDDVLYLGGVRHLVLNLIDDVKNTGLSVEQQPIGIGDVFLHLLVDARIIHHCCIGTTVSHGTASGNHVGRHIVGESRTSLNHGKVASAGLGILDSTAGENDTIANLTVSSYLCAITEHAISTYHCIMTNMSAFKQEVIITYLGDTVPLSATVDDNVLTNHVVVAYLHVRLGSAEVEILRQGSYY